MTPSLDLKMSGSSPLNFKKGPPRVLVAADSADFDRTIIRNLRAEGYQIQYLPYEPKGFAKHILHTADPLELGEKFAIVAYGKAAAAALEVCMKPVSKLCALVTYYPTHLPKTMTGLPPTLKTVVHIASDQKLGPHKYQSYSYANAKSGFAETDLDSYDKTASNLAWTRTLATVRQGFGITVDLESTWEEHLALEFITKDADATMATMVDEPYVNHVPTMTGGIGQKDLRRFYKDFFIPSNPPSMKMRLLSRTVGTDRVVDEMIISFKHTQDVPWMLPGVDPTNKMVEVALVSVVCIRGGKLYHEHIYWDQASVLAQIGLIDASKLPVCGAEAARKVVHEDSEPSNELIDEW